MEYTMPIVRQNVDEICYRGGTPDHSVCREGKRVTVTTEEKRENVECSVLHKTFAVQTLEIEWEEIVIPKLQPALNQRPNSAVDCSESDSPMEIDPVSRSSQENEFCTASQRSLSAKESNSEARHYSGQRVASVSMREIDVLTREENVKKREEAVLGREVNVKKREEAVLGREENVKRREETVWCREGDIKKREEALCFGRREKVESNGELY